MPHRIFISSNCQTAGLAAGLQALFPGSIVTAMPQPSAPESSVISRLLDQLGPADAWVRNRGSEAVLQHPDVARAVQGKTVIELPHTAFRAFHPDCVVARSRISREPVRPFLSSRIVCWGYRNQIPTSKVRALFSYDVFRSLGYLDMWNPNVERMRASFESAGLDFTTFFLRVKRNGAFMHTPAHPSIEFLFDLSKVVAMKLGRDASVMQVEAVLPDALAVGPYWPVYPEVADALAIPSSRYWRTGTDSYLDLASFIEFSYESYTKAGVSPADLEIEDAASLDKILGLWSKRL